jgi:acetate CoA/acetoacetate CoA-transferase alpha subunit
VSLIPDGISLMIGGFMGVGTPERVVDELVRQGKRDLTVIVDADNIVRVGMIGPEHVLTPAPLVDYLIAQN